MPGITSDEPQMGLCTQCAGETYSKCWGCGEYACGDDYCGTKIAFDKPGFISVSYPWCNDPKCGKEICEERIEQMENYAAAQQNADQ